MDVNHTNFPSQRASSDVVSGARVLRATEAHLQLAYNHKFAAVSTLAGNTSRLMTRMEGEKTRLKGCEGELKLSCLDIEDSDEVVRKLYTDCTAHFANINLMLDALLESYRRRSAAARQSVSGHRDSSAARPSPSESIHATPTASAAAVRVGIGGAQGVLGRSAQVAGGSVLAATRVATPDLEAALFAPGPDDEAEAQAGGGGAATSSSSSKAAGPVVVAEQAAAAQEQAAAAQEQAAAAQEQAAAAQEQAAAAQEPAATCGAAT